MSSPSVPPDGNAIGASSTNTGPPPSSAPDNSSAVSELGALGGGGDAAPDPRADMLAAMQSQGIGQQPQQPIEQPRWIRQVNNLTGQIHMIPNDKWKPAVPYSSSKEAFDRRLEQQKILAGNRDAARAGTVAKRADTIQSKPTGMLSQLANGPSGPDLTELDPAKYARELAMLKTGPMGSDQKPMAANVLSAIMAGHVPTPGAGYTPIQNRPPGSTITTGAPPDHVINANPGISLATPQQWQAGANAIKGIPSGIVAGGKSMLSDLLNLIIPGTGSTPGEGNPRFNPPMPTPDQPIPEQRYNPEPSDQNQ